MKQFKEFLLEELRIDKNRLTRVVADEILNGIRIFKSIPNSELSKPYSKKIIDNEVARYFKSQLKSMEREIHKTAHMYFSKNRGKPMKKDPSIDYDNLRKHITKTLKTYTNINKMVESKDVLNAFPVMIQYVFDLIMKGKYYDDLEYDEKKIDRAIEQMKRDIYKPVLKIVHTESKELMI